MAATSKSSQTAKNVVLALLALWSVVSLIIIVVWATSPDLKSSARCRAELQEVTEKLEGAKVVYGKNKVALEELLEETKEQRDVLRADLLVMGGRLNAINATLEECRLENVVLNWNISALQEKVELLRQTESQPHGSDRSAGSRREMMNSCMAQIGESIVFLINISVQNDPPGTNHIEALQQNVTEAGHQTESYSSLRAAAESQMLAAQSQTRPKCKEVESEAPELEQADGESSAPPTLSGIPALMLLLCSALHLITYLTNRWRYFTTISTAGVRRRHFLLQLVFLLIHAARAAPGCHGDAVLLRHHLLQEADVAQGEAAEKNVLKRPDDL
ncbi:hypothetical protein F7725_027312 [Dissostichus mawsoni]|uniref:Uncharacterized protein n=1 Tax=Dissostichus mawsoni TaxID=36200 RepID=A0A7J5XCM5_DISMA|nr:hypothetical protein F7725_027312 [Dissostichus mawsoni]